MTEETTHTRGLKAVSVVALSRDYIVAVLYYQGEKEPPYVAPQGLPTRKTEKKLHIPPLQNIKNR